MVGLSCLIKWDSLSNMTLQVWPWLHHLFVQLCTGKITTNSYWTYPSNYIAIKSKDSEDNAVPEFWEVSENKITI